jgi:hypothetical protein
MDLRSDIDLVILVIAIGLFLVGLLNNWLGFGIVIDVFEFGFNSSGIFVLSIIMFGVYWLTTVVKDRRATI